MIVVKSLYALLGDLATMQGEEYDTPEKYVEKIFQEMDRDADGYLSFEEVCVSPISPPMSLVDAPSCVVLSFPFVVAPPYHQYKNGAMEDTSIVKALGLF